MADVVTTQKLVDGPLRATFIFNNESDATGEALVKKIDVTTLNGYNAVSMPLTSMKIKRIKFATTGNMGIKLFWEATTNVLAWSMPANYMDEIDFSDIGGLQNNSGAGKTGSLLLSTFGAAAGSTYVLVLDLLKT
jgi:hypothetical protein